MRLSKVAITLFLALSFLLTGCANGTSSSGEISEREDKQVSFVGTEGQLIPIQSDNVRAAGYVEETQVMTVQFKNGYLFFQK